MTTRTKLAITKPTLKTSDPLRTLVCVAMLTAAPLLSSAQSPGVTPPPPGAPPPPFDPKALQAALEAFDKVPDTAGTGKYPAIKETVTSLPDHVIYRPADLSKLGPEKLGVLAWGNGGCAADGAGARLHLEEIASHGYLAIANGKILSGPGAPPHSPGGFPPGGPGAPPHTSGGFPGGVAPAGATPAGPPSGGPLPGDLPPGGPPSPGAHPAAGGPMPPFSIPPPATQAEGLRQAITWALAENTRAGSPYFGRINPNWVAVSGWSCGGLQALEIAADPRVHTVIVHSSGIFNAGANAIPGMTITKAALKKLHTPTLYILGGPKDIAYANGMDDFKQIDTVPVMVANLDVGHGGTFMEPNGGLEASVAVSWLDWQLKGNAQAAQRFVGPECGLCKDPVWQVERKRIAPAAAEPKGLATGP